MSEEIKFGVGDRVAAFGYEGFVVKVSKKNEYPIEVLFGSRRYVNFTLGGKLFKWHKEPSLFLVEKAKKEVLLHEYLVEILGIYCCEFHKSDEGFKKKWPTKPIIKTGRTVTIKE